MSIGVITGKFAPLHSGHIYAITEAATQVDTLYVILSFDQKFVDSQPKFLRDKLTLKKRLLWLKSTFQNLPHIKVICVDETNINTYPDGVVEWCNIVKFSLQEHNVYKVDKWFSSEPEYTWWVEEHFNCENVIIDNTRSQFNTSATEIRNNPYKHWQFLPSIVRKEFLLKVCLIGEESCGKSSLTKYLAKMFNTSWVEEYGRKYCEQDMCMDESLLSSSDYGLIASNRFYEEKQAERTANRVLFVDTNAFVTQYYHYLYEGSFHQLVDAYIKEEQYDIILHLESDVPWVDDGLRLNSDRTKTSKIFKKLLDKYEIEAHTGYHKVKGTYKQRLDQAINIINSYLNKGE
ncbi:nicotinamide-nucleotide adenylyltransferase [Vibrio phage 11895-B1]|uniref:nicotinamide-nucleotide adenylyltransferase n=1 Tax=Vibrio phage 11895-B1 TaxID=754075 RepID=UPI0002C14C6A|nr:nicotinamide-nucleotide adenylyltransferase [Vibrio phage 11895-B1]AGH32134.1 nicotinamide-nucleotide adenylyltransferase [Vibrio phage 11895-B1]